MPSFTISFWMAEKLTLCLMSRNLGREIIRSFHLCTLAPESQSCDTPSIIWAQRVGQKGSEKGFLMLLVEAAAKPETHLVREHDPLRTLLSLSRLQAYCMGWRFHSPKCLVAGPHRTQYSGTCPDHVAKTSERRYASLGSWLCVNNEEQGATSLCLFGTAERPEIEKASM